MGRRIYGNIEKLASGRFRVRYLGPDNVRRTAPTTFSTRSDASKWIATTQADIVKSQWIDPASGEVRLRDYADAWLTQRAVKGQPLAPRTIQTYRHSLDAWVLPKLGGKRLTDITPPVVRTWHAYVRQATGATATRQAYAVLRAILNTAVSDDALHRNPCRITGAGQPNSPERPLLDLTQVMAVISAMPGHLQVLTATTFWGHLRLGEVIALQHRDIDLTTGILRIERQQIETKTGASLTPPKTASQRTIHLPDQAITGLREHITKQPRALPQAPLFTRPDGALLRSWHIEWSWRQARAVAGLPNAHFHDLRHAGLTLTAQLGATQAELMRRAGHSTPQAAQVYQHAADSRDHLIAQRLSALGATQTG